MVPVLAVSGRGGGDSYKTYLTAVANTTKSFNSKVKSSPSGLAGFGVGNGNVYNTMAVKSTVEGRAIRHDYFGAGLNPTFCNVRVKGVQQDNRTARGARACSWQLNKFCKDIDDPHLPSLVKQNCQPTDCYSSALSSDTVSGAFIEYCHTEEPKPSPSTTPTHTPTSRPMSPTVVPATPAPVATASNTTMNCSDLPATTTALTPAPVATASNTTINVSGLPGTTMALPTSAAPLAATLSTGAIAGIALGASALVAAGVCIYRHCQRSSSPAAADDGLLELVTVDTAGQAKELGAQPTIKTVRKEAREEPVGEQRSSIQSPKPPRLKQRALPAIPILAGEPFPEKLGEQVIPQHESLYGNVYEDIDTCNPRRMRTAVEPDY
ncbi:hypothetical protein J7438_18370 [Thalassotalea sp. G20_0]|uniref:hypothetical protein n=1 Tax=Thalassotalea sp. G20_0 TaxID=2821093 RepID=UPI001ADABEAF|nr:hypothetical protein [Thalassotalea sp. G20_0]MBO9496030.1 hypothetical protein [Thalassotalea sp. G20_0]